MVHCDGNSLSTSLILNIIASETRSYDNAGMINRLGRSREEKKIKYQQHSSIKNMFHCCAMIGTAMLHVEDDKYPNSLAQLKRLPTHHSTGDW